MRNPPPRDRPSHELKPFAPALTFGELHGADARQASNLILKCFWRFNADQYGDNTERFTDSVTPEKLHELICTEVVVGARDPNGDLCGVICITGGSHLELLFVAEEYQRLGVATTLWRSALELVASDPRVPVEIAVNSSDHAIEFYENIGFVRVPFERPTVKRLLFQRPPIGTEERCA
jgi:ribosomal protein S18 acetylase RimI-like enzyme